MILFCCSNYSIFGHWEFFQLAPVHLWNTSINVFLRVCFEHFLIFCNCKMLQVHLVYFLPRLRITDYSKEPWFLLLENGSRNQDLGAECARCYWGIISFRPSQLIEQKKDVFIVTCIYTHIDKYFYMEPSISILAKHEFILMAPNQIHHHMDCYSYLFLLIYKLPPISETAGTTIHKPFT